eukprot:scaffold8076_cov524-Prasinococcus_capsulatus_cf.AAC.1
MSLLASLICNGASARRTLRPSSDARNSRSVCRLSGSRTLPLHTMPLQSFATEGDLGGTTTATDASSGGVSKGHFITIIRPPSTGELQRPVGVNSLLSVLPWLLAEQCTRDVITCAKAPCDAGSRRRAAVAEAPVAAACRVRSAANSS